MTKAIAFALLLGSCNSEAQPPKSAIKNGDIIFHTSQSEQSKAIQLATESTYSHCGIISIENGKIYVIEAVQPVKKTPFEEFVERGKQGKYVVKRLRNAESVLTDATLNAMRIEGAKMIGKSYDSRFNWGDDEIYCSELVWKIYERATGIHLGELKQMKDFNFGDPIVQGVLKKRYNGKIPWEEQVISPADIFDSEELVTVAD
jgi:uncharacterized protein YycO